MVMWKGYYKYSDSSSVAIVTPWEFYHKTRTVEHCLVCLQTCVNSNMNLLQHGLVTGLSEVDDRQRFPLAIRAICCLLLLVKIL